MEDRKRKGPRVPSVPQLWNDLRKTVQRVDQLATTINKLKDLLNTTDNWHARISKLIGKEIELVTDRGCSVGELLYSDRYTVGVKVKGQIRLYNKGKIEYIASV